MSDTKTKEYQVRPTLKQKRAGDNLVESGGSKYDTKKEWLIDSGYSAATAKTPSKVLESKGFKVYLKELGIDKGSRLKRMAEILHSDDKRSALGANREITKMLGEYAPTKYQDLTPAQATKKVIKEIKVTDK